MNTEKLNQLNEWEEAQMLDALLEQTYLTLMNKFNLAIKKVEKQFRGEIMNDENKFLLKEYLIKELRTHIDNRFLSRIDIEIVYHRSGDICINIIGKDGETDFKTIVRKYHPMFAFYKQIHK